MRRENERRIINILNHFTKTNERTEDRGSSFTRGISVPGTEAEGTERSKILSITEYVDGSPITA